MRRKKTNAEMFALGALARALEAQGVPPIWAPDFREPPDAIFKIDERLVAIECRHISHPKLLQFLGKRDMPVNRPYEVCLPREPHLWVKLAIDEKNPKIPQYRQKTGAHEMWLLLHSSAFQTVLTVGRRPGSEFFELLRLGAYLAPHAFHRIWFAELKDASSPAFEIYGPGVARPSLDPDKYFSSFPSYPFDRFWISRASVTVDAQGGKSTSVNLNQLAARTICLEPIDTRYKIDYEPHLKDPLRNANLTGLSGEFWDEPPKF